MLKCKDMGLETLLALAIQGVGTGVGSAVGGLGTLTGSSALTGAGSAITSAAGTAATSVGSAFGGGATSAQAGILNTGVTAKEVGTGIATAAGVAPLLKAKPKNLQKKPIEIETNVGATVRGKRKRRSVASTVQSGGIKRNSLGGS